MSTRLRFDVAVIGGGVVGLACAAALARHGKNTVVLETHRAFGTETSSRSSEVIHAGLYYPHGSAKAELCVRGAALLRAYCKEHDVPHAMVGKLVVAQAGEEGALAALVSLAQGNGARVLLVDGARARALEPEVRATAALWSPDTGIVDSHALVASLAADVERHDGTLAPGRRLVAARPAGDGFTLACDGVAGREEIDADLVVNAAGLYADFVAALFGVEVTQRFVKGSYFRVKRRLVKRLVYPLPPADGSLGVHVTVDLAGDVRLGPDVEPAASRTDYVVDESRRGAFYAAASRYLPGLREDELSPDTCGIRPKAPGGDFVIRREGSVVHLAGIESPGLTAALAIAERVVMLSS